MIVIDEKEVRAATNSRLAINLGIAQDKVLRYSGQEIYIVATSKNFEQNCKPTLDAMREKNEVKIVSEAPKQKRKRRSVLVTEEPAITQVMKAVDDSDGTVTEPTE